jgi:zinc protease
MKLASLTLALIATGCGAGAAPLPPPRLPLVRTPDAGFRRMPEDVAIAPLTVPAVHEATLASGFSVRVVPRRELPLVAIVVASRALRAVDPEVSPGVAAMTARVIERELERIAVSDAGRELPPPEVTVTSDGFLISTQVPSSELGRALSQISAVLRSDDCYDGDVELSRLAQRAAAQRAHTVGGLAEVVAWRVLYGDSDRRAVPAWGSEAIVEQIGRVHCAMQRRRGLVPNETVIAIVGDVGAEEAVRRVEETMAAWQRPAAPIPILGAPTFPIAPQNVILVPSRSEQGMVMLVERGPGPRDPGYAAFGVLARLVGGMFAARLNLELRERRGWAYGVAAERRAAADHSTLRIECTVHGSRVLETLDAIELELGRLSRADRIEEDELAIAISAERSSLLHRLESRSGIARSIGVAWLHGLEIDHLAAQDRALASLTARDVAGVAAAVRVGAAPVVLIGPPALASTIHRSRPGRFVMLSTQ